MVAKRNHTPKDEENQYEDCELFYLNLEKDCELSKQPAFGNHFSFNMALMILYKSQTLTNAMFYVLGFNNNDRIKQ